MTPAAIFPIGSEIAQVFPAGGTKKLQVADRHDRPSEINISVRTIATSWYVWRKIYRASLRRQTSAKLEAVSLVAKRMNIYRSAGGSIDDLSNKKTFV